MLDFKTETQRLGPYNMNMVVDTLTVIVPDSDNTMAVWTGKVSKIVHAWKRVCYN